MLWVYCLINNRPIGHIANLNISFCIILYWNFYLWNSNNIVKYFKILQYIKQYIKVDFLGIILRSKMHDASTDQSYASIITFALTLHTYNLRQNLRQEFRWGKMANVGQKDIKISEIVKWLHKSLISIKHSTSRLVWQPRLKLS